MNVQRNDNGKYNTRKYRKSKEFSSFVPWSSFCPKKTKLGVLVGVYKNMFTGTFKWWIKNHQKHIFFIELSGKILDIVVEQTTSPISIKSFEHEKFPVCISGFHTPNRLLSVLRHNLLRVTSVYVLRACYVITALLLITSNIVYLLLCRV